MVDHLRKKQDIPEIPRSQRYAHRPTLEKLFAGDARTNVRKGRASVRTAVGHYGYRLREIASHLGLHDSSVSRIAKGERLDVKPQDLTLKVPERVADGREGEGRQA